MERKTGLSKPIGDQNVSIPNNILIFAPNSTYKRKSQSAKSMEMFNQSSLEKQEQLKRMSTS